MNPVSLLLLCLLLSSALQAADREEKPSSAAGLQAPGTLSGYQRSRPQTMSKKPQQLRHAQQPALPRLAPPPVLRFYGDRKTPQAESFPQFGHTPGQGNPWEYGQAPVSPGEQPAPPPPISDGNPWSLEQELLSTPGIPGLDPVLPLAPADPLLSPLPYSGLPPASRYGYYPPPGTGLMPAMPFDNRYLPGFRGDHDRFPFSTPMDWFR